VSIGRAAAIVLALAAGAAQAPPAGAAPIGGIVPDVPRSAHTHAHVLAYAAAESLTYGGGPVLHSNRTHLVFWQPAGSGLVFDPGYASLVETFLAQVAADSHLPTNVYGLSGQYRDGGGAAAYDSSYGGALLDTDPLPPNGCLEPLLTGPGWLTCVNASQLANELEQAVLAHNLPTGPSDVYFLLTPYGLGSCTGPGPDSCALGGSSSGGYCGYHSVTPDGHIYYALVPYNAVPGHCQSGNPRPNSSPADPAISTLSHEHNEIVTDPLGTAWSDVSGGEEADVCFSSFGAVVGGSGGSAYNQVIHGGHYYLQEEWSNDDRSCQLRDEGDSIYFGAPRRATAAASIALAASGSDPDSSIVRHDWFFGDGRGGSGQQVSHAFKRPGDYRVVLRSADSAGNYAFYSAFVRVSAKAKPRAKPKAVGRGAGGPQGHHNVR
jgi:hypothetical protein